LGGLKTDINKDRMEIVTMKNEFFSVIGIYFRIDLVISVESSEENVTPCIYN
jgi:hypothetical protein